MKQTETNTKIKTKKQIKDKDKQTKDKDKQIKEKENTTKGERQMQI